MRPPRSTLQPIGQQLAVSAGEVPVVVPPIQLADGTDVQPALPIVPDLEATLARVQTRPLPGVVVMPAIDIARVRTRPLAGLIALPDDAGALLARVQTQPLPGVVVLPAEGVS